MQGASLVFCNHTQWWDGKVHGRFKKDGIHTHTHTVRTDLSCFMAETQENALVIASILFQQHRRRLYTWTSPMVNTEIRLIIFFAAKDGEAQYGQKNKTEN